MVLRDLLANQDHLALMVPRESEARLGQMELKVTLACLVSLVCLAPQVELVREAYPDKWDHLERMEMSDHEVTIYNADHNH